jgi:D-cysteine desulfhydrase
MGTSRQKAQVLGCCRDEELEVVMKAAMETGVVLDPVYSGKALHGLLSDINRDMQQWENSNVLFIHTGGLMGMYDKVDQLLPLVTNLERSRRMPL